MAKRRHKTRDLVARRLCSEEAIRRQERLTAMRAIAKWVTNRRYVPCVADLSRRRGGSPYLWRRVLGELIEAGLVQSVDRVYYTLTEKGWTVLCRVPVEPIFSPNPQARGGAIRAAKLAAKPEIQALIPHVVREPQRGRPVDSSSVVPNREERTPPARAAGRPGPSITAPYPNC